MKKQLQKISLMLFALLASLPAFAYDFEVDGIYYTVISLSDLTCKVTCGEESYSGDIVIPAKVQYENKTLDVTGISEYAFYKCSTLQSIEIPNSVISIGGCAFENCSSLQSIEIPNSVTSIGGGAFRYCSSLQAIEIPNSVTSIGEEAFGNCSSLQSIEIPNSVTSIGREAFKNCSSLQSIEIPKSVTSIDVAVFENCSSLQSIEIANSVTSIGVWAFDGCSSLQSIEIPNSVTSIDAAAFGNCSSLQSIEIPNSVTRIGSKAFGNCSSLESIEIPNSVTTIGDCTFSGCTNLKNIKLSENLEEIKYGTFENCEALESINIPGSIVRIELYYSFYASSDKGDFFTFPDLKNIFFYHSLEDLIFGWVYYSYGYQFKPTPIADWTNTLESIYIDRQFNNPITHLESLKDIIIGENLNRVDITIPNASNLINITSYAITPPKLPECTTQQYMDVIVKVPNEALEAYQQADGWKNFWNLEGFDPSTGIDDAQTAPQRIEIARYNLLGAPVSDDYTGIVIVRFSDGSTKKFMNK